MTSLGICQMEGHEWSGGGACVRCGGRLRCVCGRFITERGAIGHYDACPVIADREAFDSVQLFVDAMTAFTVADRELETTR